MYINHNQMASNVANTLTSHYGNLQTSTQRLSSGLRVNSAADDAAGLAIRELMRSDIAALNQGVRNANDAISLLQTADGALGVIDEKLVRMKELAEQAATGTYDSTQRLMIESEYQAMASEITRIANSTDFNNIKLLDGNLSSDTHVGKGGDESGLASTGKLKVHFGSANDSAEDYYYIQIGTSTASALGVGNQATAFDEKSDARTVSTQEAAQKALVGINNAIVSKDKIRAHLGALQNRLENTITNLTTQAENLQAAESRISDVDVATEMTQFVRNQILTQSAVAMLSQANSMPQMAMQLIG
ncbi:MAG: flagellin [Desulfovibrio sp.]|uniref:flagellin N-terminal helical domain-containing protein n=1 Tax=Desulfovibrio sp. TaxID=885 RepID=UPI001A66A91A|nr:flagellin [Desulfovibrio sp.]MBD5416752.1 flagellin [Desulfovibrio sp.]